MARHRWTPPWDSLQDREVGGTTESRKPERGGQRVQAGGNHFQGPRQQDEDLGFGHLIHCQAGWGSSQGPDAQSCPSVAAPVRHPPPPKGQAQGVSQADG